MDLTIHLMLYRSVQDIMQHDSGWVTQTYHLPSSLPDYRHLTLRSIEVAAVAPKVLPQPAASGGCLGYLGSW